MRSAKQEFIEHTQDRIVKCAWVRKLWVGALIPLVVNYTEDEYNKFLDAIDFEFSVFGKEDGEKEVYGMIWYDDGTYSIREDYGTKEFEKWLHVFVPAIHPVCTPRRN